MDDAARDSGTAARRWLWVVAASVTVALVAGVVAATRLLAEDEPGTAATSTRCVSEADAPFAELGAQRARWVRFCPLSDEGSTQRVRHPQGVVTGDLAASVAASLWETQGDRPECIPDESAADPTGLFRIEVGLADGRVAELTGDTGCSPRDKVLFSQVETTLLMAAAGQAGPPGPLPAPVTCPGRFTATRTNADGASADQLLETADEAWQSTVPVLPLPAAAADVCVYSGGRPRRDLVDQWQVGTPVSESIRAAATTEVRRGAMTDCPTDPDALSYVVVLTDATGTARTLAIDPTVCSPLQAAIGTPAVDTYLGLATNKLVQLVRDSKDPGAAG